MQLHIPHGYYCRFLLLQSLFLVNLSCLMFALNWNKTSWPIMVSLLTYIAFPFKFHASTTHPYISAYVHT